MTGIKKATTWSTQTRNKITRLENQMKTKIRMVGATLLVAGLGIGGTALSAGAASADTGSKSTTVSAANAQAVADWNRDDQRNDHRDDQRNDHRDNHSFGHDRSDHDGNRDSSDA
jgi:hypothetical protein